MGSINAVNLSEDLLANIQAIATAKQHSLDEQIIKPLQQAVTRENLRLSQQQTLQNLNQNRWQANAPIPNSEIFLREIREYDD